MLKYIRKTYRNFHKNGISAVDLLYFKMNTYNKEAKDILGFLIQETKARNYTPQLKALYQLMEKADSMAIDCAHKLAPYKSPKLESVEVKNQIEHKFVFRSPEAIKTTDEWLKITGVDKLNVEKTHRVNKKLTPIAQSIHDLDDEDEIRTHRELLN